MKNMVELISAIKSKDKASIAKLLSNETELYLAMSANYTNNELIMIAEVLKSNKSLLIVQIEHSLEVEPTNAFIDVLVTNTTLKALTIAPYEHCVIEGIDKITNALKKNNSLTYLHFTHYYSPAFTSVVDKLRAALEINRSLKTFKIYVNFNNVLYCLIQKRWIIQFQQYLGTRKASLDLQELKTKLLTRLYELSPSDTKLADIRKAQAIVNTFVKRTHNINSLNTLFECVKNFENVYLHYLEKQFLFRVSCIRKFGHIKTELIFEELSNTIWQPTDGIPIEIEEALYKIHKSIISKYKHITKTATPLCHKIGGSIKERELPDLHLRYIVRQANIDIASGR